MLNGKEAKVPNRYIFIARAQERGKIKGRHAETIDLNHFNNFLETTKPFDFDLMLEIKDKEKSAFKAVEAELSMD